MEGAPAGTVASDGLTLEELRLAARNHGAPARGARYPVTPVGPALSADPLRHPGGRGRELPRSRWAGAVERPLTLSLDDLRAREHVTMPVTFECAGNGRALLEPRPVSQPWLTEAVGTAEWGGTPLAPLLEEAGVKPGAVEVAVHAASTTASRAARSRTTSARCRSPKRRAGAARLRDERRAAAAPARLPAAARGAGLVRDAERQVARARSPCSRSPSTATRTRSATGIYDADGIPGEPVTRMLPRSLMVPPGVPDFMTRERHLEPGPVELRGRAWSGQGEIERVEVSTDGGASFSRRRARAPARAAPPGAAGASCGTPPPGEHVVCSRATRLRGQRRSRSSRPGTSRATRTTRWSASGRSCAPSRRRRAAVTDCPARCASSAASSPPAASTWATTSARSGAGSTARSAAIPAIYCIVDLHATSVAYDPRELPRYVLDTTATLIAAGLDPERCILFRQSDVREHTELIWLLCAVAAYGELLRMHQFKDKSVA